MLSCSSTAEHYECRRRYHETHRNTLEFHALYGVSAIDELIVSMIKNHERLRLLGRLGTKAASYAGNRTQRVEVAAHLEMFRWLRHTQYAPRLPQDECLEEDVIVGPRNCLMQSKSPATSQDRSVKWVYWRRPNSTLKYSARIHLFHCPIRDGQQRIFIGTRQFMARWGLLASQESKIVPLSCGIITSHAGMPFGSTISGMKDDAETTAMWKKFVQDRDSYVCEYDELEQKLPIWCNEALGECPL